MVWFIVALVWVFVAIATYFIIDDSFEKGDAKTWEKYGMPPYGRVPSSCMPFTGCTTSHKA